MRKVKFTWSEVRGDRRHYLTNEDVSIVLDRLPRDAWNGLRAVHFNDKGRTRILGYANPREKEICICALPPRVSLTRALLRGQPPEMFGAVRGKQWSEIAVRRFLLYDVLLHELGHLQMLIANPKSGRRTHAREKLAQQFANEWREQLWSCSFEHADPVHNPPTTEELIVMKSDAEQEFAADSQAVGFMITVPGPAVQTLVETPKREVNIRQSFRVWDIAALILTLGTMVCAILGAFLLDVFIQRPEGGGSVTTLIPGVVYASATTMKVCLASGLVSIVAAIVSRVSNRLRRSDTVSYNNDPETESETPKRVPVLGITSVALTSLTLLVGALAVLIAQTLVDKPQGISLSYFPQVAQNSVIVMLAQISFAALAAVLSLVRGECSVKLSVLSFVTNALLIGLFCHFEFYALGFDQDTWAPR